MGGNAIFESRPVTFEEGMLTFNWVKKNILPALKRDESDIDVLGSFGKKDVEDVYGDIDIAIKDNEDDLSELSNIIEDLGYKTKVNSGFRIISVGCPICGFPEWGFAQVDLMFTPDLEWSRFIYHSPDFRTKESKYKGLYRNILLMAIITESQKDILKKTESGGIEEIEVNILRYSKGVFRVRKNFKGKKGLVKNGKNVPGYDNFVSHTPSEITSMTVGGSYRTYDINTFEKLWSIVMSPDFKWIDKREDIIKRYVECLKEQDLPLPKEVKI